MKKEGFVFVTHSEHDVKLILEGDYRQMKPPFLGESDRTTMVQSDKILLLYRVSR